MKTGQRNDLTDKLLRQILLINPCSLWRHIVAMVSLRFRSGLVNGFLHGEPLTIGTGVEFLLQFAQRTFVRFLRTTGTVVVEPDRQFLKGHPFLVRLTDTEIVPHQIQLSWFQNFLHQLEQEYLSHVPVIGFGRVSSIANGKYIIAQLPYME